MKNNNQKSGKTFYSFIVAFLLVFAIGAVYFFYLETPSESMDNVIDDTLENKKTLTSDDANAIIDGIHIRTGLLEAEGLMTVVNNCTTCHSAKLVTQNRMGKAQWKATIRWMQEKQGPWPLGANEEIIINYLTTNYPVLEKGRRQALTNIVWYKLEE